MNVFRGLFPPLITPFHADGSLNEQGLRDHVDFVIANGADGFCAGSSTGEFMNLTRADTGKIIENYLGTTRYGGIWLSFINRNQILTVAMARSDELTAVYLRAGFLY